MGYRTRMEPGAYEGLQSNLNDHIDKAREEIAQAARSGTLETVRYHAGIQDGLRKALLILEGRNS